MTETAAAGRCAAVAGVQSCAAPSTKVGHRGWLNMANNGGKGSSSPRPSCPTAEGSGASLMVPVGGDAAALPQGRAVLRCLVRPGPWCRGARGAEGAAVPRGLVCPTGASGLRCGSVQPPRGTAATPHHALQGRLASARPVPGCSPVTTAEPGAGTTPSAPVRRSAACTAVTMPACPRPEVRAARPHAGQGRGKEAVGRGPPQLWGLRVWVRETCCCPPALLPPAPRETRHLPPGRGGTDRCSPVRHRLRWGLAVPGGREVLQQQMWPRVLGPRTR